MHRDDRPIAASPPSFWLLMAGLGTVLGLVLSGLHAPLWVYYAAPVVMGPFAVRELLRLDREEERPGRS